MKFLPEGVSSKLGMSLLSIRKNSPAITFGIGIVGVVGTAVLASRATLKLSDVIDDAQTTLEQIRTLEHEKYSEDDRKRDRVIVIAKTATKVGRLYLPAIAVGTLTIAALTTSHVTLTRRNVALTAAYATIEKAFREYRNRVVEDLGEESDRKYRFGIETDKEQIVDEDGKKKTVKKDVHTSTSGYARLFAPGNPNYQNVPEFNFLFLRGIQRVANDQLRTKGHVFLNDVYRELGMEDTQAGAVVGWLYRGDGDGFIDFGIFEDSETLRIYDFVTGRENEILVDFNVDGVIYDKI